MELIKINLNGKYTLKCLKIILKFLKFIAVWFSCVIILILNLLYLGLETNEFITILKLFSDQVNFSV